MVAIPSRRNGYYFKDGRAFPSVTTILKVIAKPQLTNWTIQQVARIALADPSLDEKEVGRAYRAMIKATAERGTAVHAVAEEWARDSSLALDDIRPQGEYRGYINGLFSFIQTHNPQPILHEVEVFSDKHGYAGKCDLVCKMGEFTWLLDWKTNKTARIYNEVGMQLVAYAEALREMELADVDKMGVVSCAENGGFAFKETRDTLEDFLHCKSMWEWSKKKEGS